MKEVWSCLVRIKSAEGLRSHLIDRQAFTVGRTQEADLPLVQKSISRVHLSVEIQGETVFIYDQRSANGTQINGQPLEPGKKAQLKVNDVVKLGTAFEELTFMAIPKPFELLGVEAQKSQLLGSMEEIAAQFETQSRQKVEKELRQARLEAEQLLAQAKKEIEIVKTQAAVEMQERRQQFEPELRRLQQEALLAASDAKMRAQREADQLIADAQKQIQKDYEEAHTRLDKQSGDVQGRSLQVLSEAEAKARTILSDAQDEAVKIRTQANEEARQQQQATTLKCNEMFAAMNEKMLTDIAQKRADLLKQSQAEAEKEKDRILRDFASKQADASQKLQQTEQAWQTKMAQMESADKEREQIQTESNSLREDLVAAKKLLSEVGELESRKEKAKTDLEQFISIRTEGLSKVENEIKAFREKNLLDFEEQKKSQQNDLAKERLRSMEEIQRAIKIEEEKYEQTKSLRAIELTQKLAEYLIPRVSDDQSATLKTDIESAVQTVFLKSTSSIRSVPLATAEQNKKKRKDFSRWALGATVCLVAAGVYYAPTIRARLFSEQSESYASRIIEERRIQSVYTPVQDDRYRNSYTENVLYMANYFKVKTDPAVMDKWTLHLNNIEMLRSMGLSEENVVQFIAKENNMVQRLGVLRDSIDAVYLDEGLSRMHKAEAEDVAELIKVLKTEANYQRFRKLERNFIVEHIKSMK